MQEYVQHESPRSSGAYASAPTSDWEEEIKLVNP